MLLVSIERVRLTLNATAISTRSTRLVDTVKVAQVVESLLMDLDNKMLVVAGKRRWCLASQPTAHVCLNESAIKKDVVLIAVAVESNCQPDETLDVTVVEAAVTDLLCTANAAMLVPTAVNTGVDYPELDEGPS